MTWRAQGLRAWLMQRVTAFYMLSFMLYFVMNLALGKFHSYETWLAWIAYPVNSAIVFLFFAALLMHAWVGMRDVLIDYLHSFWLRFVSLILLAGTLLGIGVWVARILLLVKV